ncbi:hypothetical protein J4E80_010926 [Alternaria sp. BMP 0032]|nr:hypothetical protein J4E80_010926 [Alternaria sp. BMP 0032]
MAPRRKKQKTKRAPAAVDGTVRSTTQPTIDSLSIETMQTVFSYLGFHDLIRCRHVCRKWSLYIPETSPELKKILFLTSDLPPCKHELRIQARNSFAKDAGDTFNVSPALPRIETRAPGLHVNPIFLQLKWNKLVIPGLRQFSPTSRYGIYVLDFTSMEQLRSIAISLESKVDEGLWTDMLICVPPVQKLELRLTIYTPGFCAHLTRTLADNRGIRFQDLVASLRSLLKEVTEKLIIHKVTLQHKKRIIEIFDWLGGGEDGDGTFENFPRDGSMQTEITRDGSLRRMR